MLIRPKPRGDICCGAMAFAIAVNNHIAQCISTFRKRYLIARCLHRL